MSYSKYPAYKDSGLRWLGKVPEHWEIKRLGHYFEDRREKVSDKDFKPLSVTQHGVVPRLETAAKTQNGDNRKKVVQGDFVINSRSDRKGSSGLSTMDGSVSLIYTVLKPFNIAGEFAHYLLRSESFQEEYYRWGKGIVADLWSTNFSDMKNIPLSIPPVHEQTQIVRFLDHETTRIDALIEEQQRLIALLQEKRQAVISHAVTKGLDPTVPMKDSGVEWLGEVPAHWRIGSFRRLVSSISNGTTINQTEETTTTIAVSRIETISTGEINFNKVGHIDHAEAIPKFILNKGDILFSHINSLPMVGNVAIYNHNEPLLHGMNLLRLQPHRNIASNWLHYLLKSKNIRQEVESRAKPAINQASISIDSVKEIPALIPPKAEQTQIARFLDNETDRIDMLVSEAKNGVRLLQERRSALISAAVTGKIDVRDWQPPTPSKTHDVEEAEAV
ncbi:type I restriction endonuclease subunit S [Lujinxingia vulgaris]|uniref:Type I restriction endonuclease subunit S n=1 Tax=Lujinxingia vulgaris TaxID=2600176 RepID=A0A5C6XD01_9DELT|nr:restriction endonuclease subunit S [Lujinxingia vulgaris]TXD35266.1 type I restriction endonuclease subunit S [Lujinxingia vulgaris]